MSLNLLLKWTNNCYVRGWKRHLYRGKEKCVRCGMRNPKPNTKLCGNCGRALSSCMCGVPGL